MTTEIYTNAFRQFRNPSDAMMRPHFSPNEEVQGSVCQSMARTVRPNLSVDKPGTEDLDSELWHACAGPLTSLPPVNSLVTYWPQGHIEQTAACTTQEAVDAYLAHYNLPTHIVCRVSKMILMADPDTDDVYAQMDLAPEPEHMSLSDSEEPPPPPKRNSHIFYKTLTASDTSTHGGFSVPKRSAEECLPPLDYSMNPPCQELVAKDLHGTEWRFRHIYRGHPRRHLLTTGWSVFVSSKRLVAGDTVLFLRGDNGELRLGVRRANKLQPNGRSSVFNMVTSESVHLGVLAAASHAAKEKLRFRVIYSPRLSPSEFVIPYYKYIKALNTTLTVGMRFKKLFETDESSERRYIGTITGIGDVEPERWPKSLWRSLKVGWDESAASDRHERASPWEIEPFIAPAAQHAPSVGMRLKRGRPSTLGTEEDCSKPGWGVKAEASGAPPCLPVSPGEGDLPLPNGFWGKLWRPNPPLNSGVNSLQWPSLTGPAQMFPGSTTYSAREPSQQRAPTWCLSVNSVFQTDGVPPSARPVVGGSETSLSINFSPVEPNSSGVVAQSWARAWENPIEQTACPPAPQVEQKCKLFGFALKEASLAAASVALQPEDSEVSGHSPTGVLSSPLCVDSQVTNPVNPGSAGPRASLSVSETDPPSQTTGATSGGFNPPKQAARERASQAGSQSWIQRPTRSFTKVYKQGKPGRSIDLSKFENYTELKQALAGLFQLEGQLDDPAKGWQVVYTDHESDVLLVGDDPWPEFCSYVRSIKILSPAEVASQEAYISKRARSTSPDDVVEAF